MTVYADTNFLSHLYLTDPLSLSARARTVEQRPAFPITWLLRLELTNAFEQAVFTGLGSDLMRVTPNLAAACQQSFRDDVEDGIAMRLTDLPMREVTAKFEDIALRHTAKHGFRAYDILHVASAHVLNCRQFWSFDKRASKLANLEGLEIIR